MLDDNEAKIKGGGVYWHVVYEKKGTKTRIRGGGLKATGTGY